MDDLISVIVPVYKVEKYLKKCIDSLRAQTYRHLEILLVDDGSPDACPQICDEYAKKDSRIKVIHTENVGVSNARNLALDIAKGKYIGFVDSDDWIEHQMYEVLYRTLKDSNAQISIISCSQEKETDVHITDKHDVDYNKDSIEILDSSEALKNMCIGIKYEGHLCVKLIDRNLFNSVRFPADIVICEDMMISTYLLLNANRIAYYPYCGYHYLQREDSALHKLANEKDWSVQDACRYMCRIINKSYPELSPYFDSVSMKQDLILAMRLNYAKTLTHSSIKRIQRSIRARKNKESFSILPFGCRIRINTLLVGKPVFTLCNWMLRNVRQIR